ncbi:MAG: hypothetical protein ABI113_13060 [Mucilaginibacter sp.]
MNTFQLKLRTIFLPYLIINVGLTAIYTFLNWLLVVKLGVVRLEENIANIVIPITLPWLPLIIWIRPRLKLLNLRTSGRRNPIAFIIYLCGVAMIFPIALAQLYMITATGKLTRLEYMSEINYKVPTKYYSVKHFYVAKNVAHIKPVFTVTGKYNTGFEMSIYAAVPVFDHLFPDTNMIAAMRNNLNAKGLVIIDGKLSSMQQLKRLPADSIRKMRYLNPSLVMPKYGDTGKFGALIVATRHFKIHSEAPPPKIEPAAWLTVKYTTAINNHLSIAEKDRRYKKFIRHCDSVFRRTRIDRFVYLERPPYSREIQYYLDAIKSRGDVADGFPIVLSPVYDSYANKNGHTLALVFGSLAIGSGLFLLVIGLIKLKAGANDSE